MSVVLVLMIFFIFAIGADYTINGAAIILRALWKAFRGR